MEKGATDDTRKSPNSKLVHDRSSWSIMSARESQDKESLSWAKQVGRDLG